MLLVPIISFDPTARGEPAGNLPGDARCGPTSSHFCCPHQHNRNTQPHHSHPSPRTPSAPHLTASRAESAASRAGCCSPPASHSVTMPLQPWGSTIIHIKGSSGKDNKARKAFQREFECVECGHTVYGHPGRSMVAAHCYDKLHPEAVFLITTCSKCNRNGSDSGGYFTCLRNAHKEYLYDSDGNIKGIRDYEGHGNQKSPRHKRYTRAPNPYVHWAQRAFTIQVPLGYGPGMPLQVRLPTGQIGQITIPLGAWPGSQFQVPY